MKKQSAFTLLELMITVVIVALLATIAVPSYKSFMISAHRADAIAMMQGVLDTEERYMRENNTYTTTLGSGGLGLTASFIKSEYYDFSAAQCGTAALTVCIEITATPISGTHQDQDGNLVMNTSGKKEHNGAPF